MKILVFGLDLDIKAKFVYSEEEFFDEIFKDIDVLIINFSFLGSFLEVRNYFKGKVIFVYYYVDELIYKKALEYGDFLYTYEELWKIPYRLKKIQKSIGAETFKFKDLLYNFKTKSLFKNGLLIKLSDAERDILESLIKSQGFVSKLDLMEKSENVESIDSVKVLISRLRRLGFEIENQKNLGYRIRREK